jgi:hypothetical protein
MMGQRVRTLLVLLALVIAWGLAACGGDETAPDSDGGSFGWWPSFTESPEDCYDDEVYDPVDQLCYLADDGEEDYGSLFGEILAIFWGDDASYQGLEDLGEVTIITYDVTGNAIENPRAGEVDSDLQVYQDDTETHEAIWLYFVSIIPPEQRSFVTGFVIFTDGEENTYAAVMQNDDNPMSWMLAVDIIDAVDHQELTYSLIHEFGHLLTLNDAQVDLDPELFYRQDDDDLYAEALSACPTYFPGEGCSRPASYINLFYERFWVDLEEEFWELEAIEDEDEFDEALLDFYERYADHFVTEYAATNVAEDIAESWTAFVLQPRPDGQTIAGQKMLFFYEFPELVELRDDITARLYSRLRRQPATTGAHP